jgi:hypothetical protein
MNATWYGTAAMILGISFLFCACTAQMCSPSAAAGGWKSVMGRQMTDMFVTCSFHQGCPVGSAGALTEESTEENYRVAELSDPYQTHLSTTPNTEQPSPRIDRLLPVPFMLCCYPALSLPTGKGQLGASLYICPAFCSTRLLAGSIQPNSFVL